MPSFEFTSPEGKKYTVDGPEGATKEQAYQMLQTQIKAAPAAAPPIDEGARARAYIDQQKKERGDAAFKAGNSAVNSLAGGAAMGVSDLGNTALNVAAYLPGKVSPGVAQWNRTRNADFDAITQENKGNALFNAARVGGNVLATAPVGGALGAGVKAAAPLLTQAGATAPFVNSLAQAVATSGFRTGAAPAAGFAGKAADLAMRTAGGAVTGGVSAGLVDPSHAGEGALIGGALPGAAKLVNSTAKFAGQKVLSAVAGGAVSPEVAQLAQRAKELGIDIPADRIANSKPLNALAASLNYVPLSGRAATEKNMQSQLNRALSRTFGQDTENVTMGLSKAREQLGGEFDRVLQSNTVRVDEPFMAALAQAGKRAGEELETGQAAIIHRQIDEIMAKASANGQIDGQAAYNIKKTLDRIGKRNSPEAFYASDLKRDLMEALNRSMTPDAAAAFAKTRKQYGNMLSLDSLAQNGVDGDVSITRIANMKNIGNKDLQELADISAQFLKARESQHGASQRVNLGSLAAVGGYPVALAGGAIAGRAANMALNSNPLKNLLMGQPVGGSNRLLDMITDPRLRQQAYRAAPIAGKD